MANFPTSPAVGEQFSTSKVTYRWNGSAWDVLEGVKQGIIATYPSSNTKLLLHGETVTDSSVSAHTVTANGDAAVSSAQTKFGTSSYIFDGSGDSLSIPDSSDFNFGSDDFTLEMWIHWTAFNSHSAFMSCPKGGNEEQGFYWYMHNDGSANDAMYFRWRNTAGTRVGYKWSEASLGFVVDTWYHIAVVRYGETFKLYVNGEEQTPDSVEAAIGSTTLNDCDGSWFIGGHWNGSMGSTGHIDEVRISNTARYTANFTPEGGAFANPVILPIGNLQFTEGSEPDATAGASTIYATSGGMYVKNSSGSVTALTADAALTSALTTVTSEPVTIASTGQMVHWDRSAEGDATIKLLLNGETLTDSSSNAATVTHSGGGGVSSTQKKYGSNSLEITSNTKIRVPRHSSMDFGTADFTIDFWCYAKSVGHGNWGGIVSFTGYSGGPLGGYLHNIRLYDNTTEIAASTSAGFGYVRTGHNLTLNTWTHVAFVREGTDLKVYVGGTLVSTTNVGAVDFTFGQETHISLGESWIDYNDHHFDGFIDDFCIRSGAKWTANFTPPSSQTNAAGSSGLYYVAPDGTKTLIQGDS